MISGTSAELLNSFHSGEEWEVISHDTIYKHQRFSEPAVSSEHTLSVIGG